MITLSTAAAFGVPAIGLAQTPAQQPPAQHPPAQQPPAQAQPAEQAPMPPDADRASEPQEHLREAKAALDRIQTTSLTSRGRTQLAELKRHLTALERAGATNGARNTPKTTSPANASWGTEVAAMDKILTDLLGADSTTGTSGMTGTGVSGTPGATRSKAATTVALDETTRAALMEVRSHIVAYAAGMSGSPTSDGATPSAATPASPTPSEEQPPVTPSAATPSAATPSAATPASPTPSPATAAGARPQIDQEAARRQLTAARETLTQLTKLPAAAQLTGEARTQVSQLIANFNELITTTSEWRPTHAKVAANLSALLGPDTTDAEAARGVPSPTAETPAVPGVVGTSGTATADLDPAVRAKLVELRRSLTEFEKAMGGPRQD
jgi:hypothetical protein